MKRLLFATFATSIAVIALACGAGDDHAGPPSDCTTPECTSPVAGANAGNGGTNAPNPTPTQAPGPPEPNGGAAPPNGQTSGFPGLGGADAGAFGGTQQQTPIPTTPVTPGGFGSPTTPVAPSQPTTNPDAGAADAGTVVIPIPI